MSGTLIEYWAEKQRQLATVTEKEAQEYTTEIKKKMDANQTSTMLRVSDELKAKAVVSWIETHGLKARYWARTRLDNYDNDIVYYEIEVSWGK